MKGTKSGMVRTTEDWDTEAVRDRAERNNSRGGVGDDPAEILSVEPGWDNGVWTDYCDYEPYS